MAERQNRGDKANEIDRQLRKGQWKERAGRMEFDVQGESKKTSKKGHKK